jgi:hypothetical protein
MARVAARHRHHRSSRGDSTCCLGQPPAVAMGSQLLPLWYSHMLLLRWFHYYVCTQFLIVALPNLFTIRSLALMQLLAVLPSCS